MLAQGDLPEAFFQLLVEVVKVEALVTLRDALSPDAHVPLSHAPRPTPEQPSMSAATAAEPSSSAPMDQDSDDDDIQGPRQPALCRSPACLCSWCTCRALSCHATVLLSVDSVQERSTVEGLNTEVS